MARSVRRGGARGRRAAIACLCGIIACLFFLLAYLERWDASPPTDLPALFALIPLWFYIAVGIAGAAIAGIALHPAEEAVAPRGEFGEEPRVVDEVVARTPFAAVDTTPPVASYGVPFSEPAPSGPPRPEVATTFAPPKPAPSGKPVTVWTAAPPVSPRIGARFERVAIRSAPVTIRPADSETKATPVPEAPPKHEPVSIPERAPEPIPEPKRIETAPIEPSPLEQPPRKAERPAASEPDVLAEEPAAAPGPPAEPEAALEDLADWLQETSPEALAAHRPRVLKKRVEPPA